MNSALLYRQHGRCIFWIAFISALAIHLGAVALAKTKPPTTKLEDLSLLGDVELVDVAESEPALEESVTSPPLEQIHRIRTVSGRKMLRLHLFARIGRHGHRPLSEEQRRRCVP